MKLTDEQKALLYEAMIYDGVYNWEGYQGEHYQKAMEDIQNEGLREETKKELAPLFEIITCTDNVNVEYPAGVEAGAGLFLTADGEDYIVDFIIKTYKN